MGNTFHNFISHRYHVVQKQMKTCFIIQLLFIVCSSYAQPDSIKEAMKYYPLNDGNYWEYDAASGSDPYHYSISPLYWFEVSGDTMLSNNKTYKVIHRGSFYDKRIGLIFERVDTSDASVYRYQLDAKVEFKIDSLLSKPGDRINADRFGPMTNPLPTGFGLYCYAVEEKKIFGQVFTVKKMNANTRIPSELYELAKGLGFVFSEVWEGSYWSERLRYARIDGVEYGNPVGVKSMEKLPLNYLLYQNYPNPFNPSTVISYQLPVDGYITLKIYDLIGREVVTLVDKFCNAGSYNV